MSRHRSLPVRPRYGRIAAVCASVLVTLVAVLGGIGVLPTGGQDAAALTASLSAPMSAEDAPGAAGAKSGAVKNEAADSNAADATTGSSQTKEIASAPRIAVDPAVAPAQSGEGKRVVFSQDEQRVWLIDDDNDVERTYLVSGSVYDNLNPGSYAVFSRSEQAWGIDDSGTMNWFVRFAHGPNAAIGFHDIPVDDGEEV